jgi:hypothetical protein
MNSTFTRRSRKLVTLALAGLLFFAACGGDDDDSDDAGSSNGSATTTTVANGATTTTPLNEDLVEDDTEDGANAPAAETNVSNNDESVDSPAAGTDTPPTTAASETGAPRGPPATTAQTGLPAPDLDTYETSKPIGLSVTVNTATYQAQEPVPNCKSLGCFDNSINVELPVRSQVWRTCYTLNVPLPNAGPNALWFYTYSQSGGFGFVHADLLNEQPVNNTADLPACPAA